ncbi:MAG: hypothetical protein HY897_21345 [Deltaproteobacteria bacterium]|nr:hypothetical protein [Deltaproteobacteria bacterium]
MNPGVLVFGTFALFLAILGVHWGVGRLSRRREISRSPVLFKKKAKMSWALFYAPGTALFFALGIMFVFVALKAFGAGLANFDVGGLMSGLFCLAVGGFFLFIGIGSGPWYSTLMVTEKGILCYLLAAYWRDVVGVSKVEFLFGKGSILSLGIRTWIFEFPAYLNPYEFSPEEEDIFIKLVEERAGGR